MANDKKYWGININQAQFQGVVTEDPEFFDNGTGGNFTVVHLLMYVSEQSANGQWVEVENIVPITVLDQSKVEAVRKHVKAGRQLNINAYYKAWVVNGAPNHAVVATKISFGNKPKDEAPEANNIGANVPPAPAPKP